MIRPRLFAASLLATLSACSAPGLLSGIDSLYPSRGDGAEKVASAVRFGPDPTLTLDVFAPRRKRTATLPVVIFYYGGGWVSGSSGDYAFAGRAFASNGFIAVLPNYRLVPNVHFPTFVQDSALAVKWARDHVADYGGDPKRITVSGHSAGAYNAAMITLDRHYLSDIGVDPSIIRAAALLAGPYDFYPFTEQRGRDALGNWPRPRETQPITFARADSPPMLLVAGTADTVVKPRNSQALAKALTSLGAPVELKLYPGKSHIDLAKSLSKPFRGNSPALADSVAFLKANSR